VNRRRGCTLEILRAMELFFGSRIIGLREYTNFSAGGVSGIGWARGDRKFLLHDVSIPRVIL